MSRKTIMLAHSMGGLVSVLLNENTVSSVAITVEVAAFEGWVVSTFEGVCSSVWGETEDIVEVFSPLGAGVVFMSVGGGLVCISVEDEVVFSWLGGRVVSSVWCVGVVTVPF